MTRLFPLQSDDRRLLIKTLSGVFPGNGYEGPHNMEHTLDETLNRSFMGKTKNRRNYPSTALVMHWHVRA